MTSNFSGKVNRLHRPKFLISIYFIDLDRQNRPWQNLNLDGKAGRNTTKQRVRPVNDYDTAAQNIFCFIGLFYH